MTLETTVKYIQNVSTFLSEKRASNAIFNIVYELRDICAHLEDSSIIKLPKQLTAASTVCPYCHSRWDTGHFQPVLKPVQRKKSFTKLLSKDPSSLNAYQRKFLDNCMKDIQNTMVLKCLKCLKTTKIKLRKPLISQEVVVQEDSVENVLKKKKKRKKKDLFVGLNDLYVSDKVKNKKENIVQYRDGGISKSLTTICAKESEFHTSSEEQAFINPKVSVKQVLVDSESTEVSEQVSFPMNQKKYNSSKEKTEEGNKSIQVFSKKSNIIQPNGSVKKKKTKKHKMKERKKEFFSGKLSNKKTLLLLDEIL